MILTDPLQKAIRTFLAGYSAPSSDQVMAYKIALRTMDVDLVIKGLRMAQEHFADRRPNPGQLKLYLQSVTGGPQRGAGGVSRVSGDSSDRVELEPGYRAVVSFGSVVRAEATHLVDRHPTISIRNPMDSRHELYHDMARLAKVVRMPWPLEVSAGVRSDLEALVTIPLPHGGWWARGLGVAMYDEFGTATLIARHRDWSGPLPDDVYSCGQDAFVELGG